MTGRNITVRNATIASGRSDEGAGGLIATTDRDRGSPAMDNVIFTLEQGGRLTGVTIRGPHWNYTDSPVIPGYIPMAPGAMYAAREDTGILVGYQRKPTVLRSITARFGASRQQLWSALADKVSLR